MADKTVYPYGQNGNLPNSIGIVNDLTTGGADQALSAEQGKILGEMLLGGQGTFASAYDKARANTTHFFPWLLQDTDENGDTITKMIWHVGNKRFIDAIGADIDGVKNGVTAWVSSACDMKVNGKTFQLQEGENNISLSEIGATNNQCGAPSFYDSGTDTVNKSYLKKIDFGGLKTSGDWDLFSSYPNVTRIDRMVINMSSWSNGMLHDLSKLEYVQLSGTFTAYKLQKLLKTCPKLLKADLSGFNVTITDSSDAQLSECFLWCSVLKEVDIRGFDTSYCRNFSGTFNQCNALKKITIGNFSNAAMTTKGTLLANTTGCTLICTTTTPPVLKNCAFSEGVAQDAHALTYDWLSYTSNNVEYCRFSAIYVPDEAVDTYKNNVYVENGTVGNTGWSYYASIIKGVSEYVE